MRSLSFPDFHLSLTSQAHIPWSESHCFLVIRFPRRFSNSSSRIGQLYPSPISASSAGACKHPAMSTEADQQSATDAGQQHENVGPEDKASEEPKTYRQIAAEHIDTLNEINHQIPKLLKYFATALSQLTNDPSPFQHDAMQCEPGTLEARKEAFRINALFCGTSCEIIRQELVKQINALERYKVIPKNHPKFAVSQRQAQKGKEEESDVVDPEKDVKNGGYGDFDVGALNARASSGQVGAEDVLDRAKAVLEELQKRTGKVSHGDDMAIDG